MMKLIINSWFIRTSLASFVIFVFAAKFSHNEPFMIVMRALQAGVAVGVLVAFSKKLGKAILASDPDPYQKAMLAIEGVFFGMLLAGLVAFVFRAAGSPPWLYQTDIIGFPVWIGILSGVLLLFARDAMGTDNPPKDRIVLGCVLTGVTLIALLVFAYGTPIGPALEKVRPWIEEDHIDYP